MFEVREFQVQGSDPAPYKVIFKANDGQIKASCTCRAGVMGQLCKHRLSILNGDSSAVVSPNASEVADVVSWLEGSNLAEAISVAVQLEAEKKLLEERLKSAKKAIAKALI